MTTKSRPIGIVFLTMLNIAAVLSMVNYPDQAEYGYRIIAYTLISTVLFLIPVALVAAELASGWPYPGGLYLWGKTAFGPRWGITAILLQWLNTLPLYGVTLTFVATTIAFVVNPAWANSPTFVYTVIFVLLWGITLLETRGVKTYAVMGSASAFFGTILPTLLLVGAAIAYFASGHAPVLPFHASSLLPDPSDWNEWMFLAGIMVSLAGLDMTALHIGEVATPKRTYPAALAISTVIIVTFTIGGALAIALTVPPAQLSTASGTAEALSILFDSLKLSAFTPVAALLMVLGGCSTVAAWVLGPSTALLEASTDGNLPVCFTKVNKHAVPLRILLLQAALGSVIALAVFFMPSIGSAFWFLMALTAQVYMTMYIMLFLFGIRLIRKYETTERTFRIPGGKNVFTAICGIGIASCLTAMLAGYIPPPIIRNQGVGECLKYIGALAGCFAGLCALIALAAAFSARKAATNP
ncbi:MAG: APC family permease [Victivallaceae bacterium]|nr:APC family permease [Victivallaceae bacterium]